MRRWIALLAVGLAACLSLCFAAGAAGQNGVLLVAKPDMADPNFRETVVVVARTPDASSVGVILNRPSEQRLADLAPAWPGARDYQEPLYVGGPVMRQVVVAMFAADEQPAEAAFPVLPHVFLSMHPKNIDAALAQPGARVRLFAGFSGWAPLQLEAEMDAGSWYALRVTESVLFRKDTSGLWRELVDQASGARTGNDSAAKTAAILPP